MVHYSYNNGYLLPIVGLLLYMVVLSECIAPNNYPGKGCTISNIAVQQNFDVEKYSGAWYEVDWLPVYFDKPSNAYVDYVEEYSKDDSSKDMKVYSYGRTNPSYDTCNEKAKLYTYVTPAKYYYYGKDGNQTIQIDYWIISTDYEHYSLCYGCTQKSGDICDSAHAWIWSRQPTLEDKYYTMINASLPGLCLSLGDFINTPQNKECRDVVADAANRPVCTVMAFILLLSVIHRTFC